MKVIRLGAVSVLMMSGLQGMIADKATMKLRDDFDREEAITFLIKAIREGDFESCCDYIGQFNPRIRGEVMDLPLNEFNETLLHKAITNQAGIDVIERLVVAGANLNARTKKYLHAPLHKAAFYGDTHVINCILKNHPKEQKSGAILARTDEMLTPLHCAAAWGNVNALKCLLTAGTPIDIEGKDHVTPLCIAAHHDQPESIVYLYWNGASLTAPLQWSFDMGGDVTIRQTETPIEGAERFKKVRAKVCLEMLFEWEKIKSSKDIDAPNRFFLPLENGLKGSLLSLFNAGYGTLLMKAAYEGFQQMVSLFLTDPRTLVNMQDSRGNTALHYAAQKGHTEIVQLLLTKKQAIDINSQNEDGNTPLHLASLSGYREVIKVLLSCDTIDRERKNKKGYTAAQLTPGYSQPSSLTSAIPLSINAQNDTERLL